MKFRNLNKIVGIVFGIFTLFSGFTNNASATGNMKEVSESNISDIASNVSYKERLIDLGNLNQYSNLYSLLENMSSKLGFECFCGKDCFEEHLCTYKKGKQDSLSIILRGLSNNGSNKLFIREILSFFEQIGTCDTASNINFYYTTV